GSSLRVFRPGIEIEPAHGKLKVQLAGIEIHLRFAAHDRVAELEAQTRRFQLSAAQVQIRLRRQALVKANRQWCWREGECSEAARQGTRFQAQLALEFKLLGTAQGACQFQFAFPAGEQHPDRPLAACGRKRRLDSQRRLAKLAGPGDGDLAQSGLGQRRIDTLELPFGSIGAVEDSGAARYSDALQLEPKPATFSLARDMLDDALPVAGAVGKPFQYDRRLDQIEAIQLEPADQQWPGRKPSLEAPYLHHLRL